MKTKVNFISMFYTNVTGTVLFSVFRKQSSSMSEQASSEGTLGNRECPQEEYWGNREGICIALLQVIILARSDKQH